MNEEKARDYIKNNFIYGVVAIVSVVFILKGLVTIAESGKTVWEILADGFITFLFGYSVSRLLGLQGILVGKRNPSVMLTASLHAETVVKIQPYFERLESWCDKKNGEALQRARSVLLAEAGLRYCDYFAPDGIFIGDKKAVKLLEREKRRAVLSSRRLRLKRLTVGELSTHSGRDLDVYDFGKTEERYMGEASLSGAAGKLLSSIVFGCFCLKLLDFSWANLLWTALQAAFFLLSGSIKLVMSYFFVTTDLRSGTIRKIDTLEQFLSEMTREKENDKNKT